MAINRITSFTVTSYPTRLGGAVIRETGKALREVQKDLHYAKLDDLECVFNDPKFVKEWVAREKAAAEKAAKKTKNLTQLAENRSRKAAKKAAAREKSKTPNTPAVLYCQIPGTDQFKKVPLEKPINTNEPNSRIMKEVQKEADHMNHEEMRDAWKAAEEDYMKINGKEWVPGTVEGFDITV